MKVVINEWVNQQVSEIVFKAIQERGKTVP